MLKLHKNLVLDENQRPIAVQIPIEEFERLEEAIENYGLAKMIDEVADDDDEQQPPDQPDVNGLRHGQHQDNRDKREGNQQPREKVQCGREQRQPLVVSLALLIQVNPERVGDVVSNSDGQEPGENRSLSGLGLTQPDNQTHIGDNRGRAAEDVVPHVRQFSPDPTRRSVAVLWVHGPVGWRQFLAVIALILTG